MYSWCYGIPVIIALRAAEHYYTYRITGFNCVLKSLRFRDFQGNCEFVWHMSYYLNRSGYPLVLVLGTKCFVPFSAEYLPIAARSSGVKLVVYFLFLALPSALGARSIAFSTAWFTCWATYIYTNASPPRSRIGYLTLRRSATMVVWQLLHTLAKYDLELIRCQL